MKEIFTRRSIRKYKDQPVDDEQLQKLLRAAMYAPSAGNEKPWHFVVLKDRENLNTITEFHPHTQMLKEAPLAIIVCADTSNVKYDGAFWVQDIAASIQNILLEGEALGLGTCWCGVYPNEKLVENMAKLINLPEHIIPVAIVAVGHSAEVREVRERYNPERVHYENW
jgi:nitroreductase